jgi:hypothetical protein
LPQSCLAIITSTDIHRTSLSVLKTFLDPVNSNWMLICRETIAAELYGCGEYSYKVRLPAIYPTAALASEDVDQLNPLCGIGIARLSFHGRYLHSTGT